jgi:hypothetical protein
MLILQHVMITGKEKDRPCKIPHEVKRVDTQQSFSLTCHLIGIGRHW